MRTLRILLSLLVLPLAEGDAADYLARPAGTPYVNSLGMKFVPVSGTDVLFSVWETRVRDFEAFVAATGYDATDHMLSLGSSGWGERRYTWKDPGFPQTPDHPVCGVAWEDAVKFAVWLTERERRAGRLTAGQRYRLPTDREWSAAVGLPHEAGATPKERSEKVPAVYPWGRSFPPPAGAGNYAGAEAADADWPKDWGTIGGYRDAYARTASVGSFAGNNHGIFDLGGNVSEWCEDYWQGSSGERVLRGGSYIDSSPRHLLSSYRDGAYGDGPPLSTFGFRLVLVGVSVSKASEQKWGDAISEPVLTAQAQKPNSYR